MLASFERLVQRRGATPTRLLESGMKQRNRIGNALSYIFEVISQPMKASVTTNNENKNVPPFPMILYSSSVRIPEIA